MPTQQSWFSLILIVGLLKIGFRYAYITLMIQFNINRWFAHGWMVSSMPNQQSWFNLILIVGLYTQLNGLKYAYPTVMIQFDIYRWFGYP